MEYSCGVYKIYLYAILKILSKYLNVFSLNILNLDFMFLEQFWVYSITELKVEKVLLCPLLHMYKLSSPSTACTRVLHLFQSINLQ